MSSRRAVRRTAALALAIAAACAGDPIAELEAHRARYEVDLLGFVVEEDPVAGTSRVLLDVLVRGDAEMSLPGITLEVSIAGPTGAEKEHRRVWVETVGVGPGGEQVSLPLEGLDYQAGDGFHVAVRSPVPVAERGDYREFEGKH
jgi:hypothetical protein